jgi:hypothetical protein
VSDEISSGFIHEAGLYFENVTRAPADSPLRNQNKRAETKAASDTGIFSKLNRFALRGNEFLAGLRQRFAMDASTSLPVFSAQGLRSKHCFEY